MTRRELLMKRFLRNLTLAFAAGCLGGLANSLVVWFFRQRGITTALGVSITPGLTLPIVWGGIWGVLFILPIFRSYLLRGLIFSLVPTAVQLFVVFPKADKGIMGLDLGNLTPLFVLIFNAVWGIVAGLWLIIVMERRKKREKQQTPQEKT
jgi:hypothetical protein